MARRTRPLAVALALLISLSSPGAAPAAAVPDVRFGVAEGFRDPATMAELNAGWERLVFGWDQIQPTRPGDFSRLGFTISDQQLQDELKRGTRLVGLIEFTPEWAAANPAAGKRSPPKNLYLPWDHPDNYWGRVVFETVRHYKGRIDDWVIWNEPEFKPGDPGAGGSYTWLGTEEEFAQLLRVGYMSARRANPSATVSFPGTSYWADYLSGRPQFYQRVLELLALDPNAPANNYYHDAVSLNVYRAPDDVYRLFHTFKDIQRTFKLDKPMWLTETNAMPTDDPLVPCSFGDAPIQTTMDQQAAYIIQAFSLAAAAGYGRFGVYQMVDADPCSEPAVWGITRGDGSRRPIAEALRVAIAEMGGYSSARFEPLTRETQAWSPWPDDSTSLTPNWRVYQVVMDRSDNRRVSVLWNGDRAALRARVRQNGARARVVDRRGASRTIQPNDGWWVVDLPGATAHAPSDPEGYHVIGGDPMLLVEDEVRPGAPIAPPALGMPSEATREYQLFSSHPYGQTVTRGEVAAFSITSRGYEGFSQPIALRLGEWSTQRVPQRQDSATLPLATNLTPRVSPGETATLRIGTSGAEPGIYFLRVVGEGGGLTRYVDFALVVN